MKEQNIVDKIVADAEEHALRTVAEANRRAAERVEAAHAAAAEYREEQLSLLSARHEEALRRKEITARLECNKLALSARREVLDSVFSGALKKLCALPEGEYVAFVGRLLSAYADEGETVVLSDHCGYGEKISALPVFREKRLTLAAERGKFAGGFRLIGGTCDKNLTFEALVAAAREEKQAEIAAVLFG